MSRTKRKDYYIQADGQPFGAKKWHATGDKKKWYKPNKKFKKAQRKRDASKPKQKLKEAFVHGDDWDGIILPDAKKHDVWDYN